MIKSTYHHIGMLLIALLSIPLAGCSDDDDIGSGYSEYRDAVVGEWYAGLSANIDFMERIVFEFGKDGSFFVVSNAISSQNYQNEKGEGSYIVNGKMLKETYTMYGMSGSSEYEIKSVSKYNMLLFLKANQLEELDYRIVETIHIKEGNTNEASVNDPDFVPEAYYSDNELVATVDNSGNVHALRQGTAYILIKSSIGTAAIRVVVESETFIDDFQKYMGEDMSVVTKAYGNLYSENSFSDELMQRHYYLLDDKVKQVIFRYNKEGIVQKIVLSLCELSDVEKTKNAFYQEYEFEAEMSDTYIFSTIKNSREIRIFLEAPTGIIELFYENEEDPYVIINDIIKDLATKTASEAFSEIGLSLSEDERNMGFVFIPLTLEVFSDMIIEFDPVSDKILQISLISREGVSFEDLDRWYGQHYIATGYEDESSDRYMVQTPRMYISFEEFMDSYLISYTIN